MSRCVAIGGDYTFAADLGTIEGLEGDLNAVGKMSGTIEQIATTGQTRTEKFRLTELDGDPLPLTTAYDAIVDGTKGDVEFQRVDVHLGKSEFTTKGVVEGTKGVKGKRVVLNVKSTNANLGELLRFVSKGAQPPAYGKLVIDTAFDLPQGKSPVLQPTATRRIGAGRACDVHQRRRAGQDRLAQPKSPGQTGGHVDR